MRVKSPYLRVAPLLVVIALAGSPARAQQPEKKTADSRRRAPVSVRVVLPKAVAQAAPAGGVDIDIVPSAPGGDVRTLTTSLDGTASTTLLPGRYQLVTRPTYAEGRWWCWDLDIPVDASGYSVELNPRNVSLLPLEDIYAQLDPAAPYIRVARRPGVVMTPQMAALHAAMPYGRFNDYLGAQPPPPEVLQARATVPQAPAGPATASAPPSLPQGERASAPPVASPRPVTTEHVIVEAPPVPQDRASNAATTPVPPVAASSSVPAPNTASVSMPAPAAPTNGVTAVSAAVSNAAQPAPMSASAAPVIPSVAPPPPVALALLIDNSENMRRTNETVARALQQIEVPERADSALLHFQKRAVLDQPLRSGRPKLQTASPLPPPRGGAALYDGVIAATNTVAGSAQRSKAVVVVSAGDDTASRAKAKDVVSRASAVPGLAVYGIVVGDGSRSQDLQDLANQTGGVVYSAHDPAQVVLAYDAIARRLTDRSAVPSQVAAAPEVKPDQLRSFGFQRPLALYNTILVDPIPVAANAEAQDFPAGDDFILQRVLMAKLRDSRVFSKVLNGSDPNARQDAAALRGVQLSGAVVKYKKGSRMKRALIGFGAAKMLVRFVLRDIQSGQVLAVLDKEGSGGSGLLTGGGEQQQETQALLAVVNGVMKDIQRNR